MEDGSVNALGGNGKRGALNQPIQWLVDDRGLLFDVYIASFTVHVKGTRKVALQNVKDPEKWLQVKDDELSGTVS